MTIEDAYLAKARPYMMARKALLILQEEAGKGCRPEIVAQPVSLEPIFRPILSPKDMIENDNPLHFLPERPTPEDELIRLNVWVSCQFVGVGQLDPRPSSHDLGTTQERLFTLETLPPPEV